MSETQISKVYIVKMTYKDEKDTFMAAFNTYEKASKYEEKNKKFENEEYGMKLVIHTIYVE